MVYNGPKQPCHRVSSPHDLAVPPRRSIVQVRTQRVASTKWMSDASGITEATSRCHWKCTRSNPWKMHDAERGASWASLPPSSCPVCLWDPEHKQSYIAHHQRDKHTGLAKLASRCAIDCCRVGHAKEAWSNNVCRTDGRCGRGHRRRGAIASPPPHQLALARQRHPARLVVRIWPVCHGDVDKCAPSPLDEVRSNGGPRLTDVFFLLLQGEHNHCLMQSFANWTPIGSRRRS